MDDIESTNVIHEFNKQYGVEFRTQEDVIVNENIEIGDMDGMQRDDRTAEEDEPVKDKRNEDESVGSNEFYSPGGRLYWIPNVPNILKPNKDMRYRTEEDVNDMYYAYAYEGGFDVRKTTLKKANGNTTLRYLVCNREGEPNTSTVDTLDLTKSKSKRRTSLIRTGCPACLKYHVIPGTNSYAIYEFVEKHNHKLVSKDNLHLLRGKWKLNFYQQEVIYKMSNQNVGAMSCHRIMSGIEGGYNVRSALPNDFKFFWRDLNCFLGGSDAQMLIDKMISRKENVSNFSFDYKLDGRKLDVVFWADETSKIQYNVFGDVVSFDATYSTNRYDMIFVPFTGIDNHKKCVTFGAGLLSNELAESYVWLLEAFLRAFGNPPSLILSDQDPAMKKAIADVMPHSHHRLCMWHITTKLSKKIDWDIFNRTDFKMRFNYLVWNSILDEEQFEEGWKLMIKDFKLTEKKWLKDMYDLRHTWIPSYFKHVPISGLMRTTSRSESQNSSFQNSTQRGAMLMNFMTSFETSMEKQRFDQSVLDFMTNETEPKMRTFLKIERNASKHYTRKLFFQVQNEIIHSVSSCTQKCVTNSMDIDSFVIRERKDNTECIVNEDNDSDNESNNYVKDSEFQVIWNKREESFKCECMLFEHMGILCRHIFCVFKYVGYDDIPKKYILRRWTKDVIPTEMLRKSFRYGDNSNNVDRVAIEVYSIVNHCMSTLANDKDKLDTYLEKQKELMTQVDAENKSGEKRMGKSDCFERLLGVKKPAVVDIQNPGGIKTKGCGTHKRIKSSMEISKQKNVKEGRTCSICRKKDGHNARSCPDGKKSVELSDNGKSL